MKTSSQQWSRVEVQYHHDLRLLCYLWAQRFCHHSWINVRVCLGLYRLLPLSKFTHTLIHRNTHGATGTRGTAAGLRLLQQPCSLYPYWSPVLGLPVPVCPFRVSFILQFLCVSHEPLSPCTGCHHNHSQTPAFDPPSLSFQIFDTPPQNLKQKLLWTIFPQRASIDVLL